MLKEYFKWVWKRKYIIGAFLLYAIIFAILISTNHIALALIWFIIAVVIGVSFSNFYYDYKRLDK